MRVSFPAMRGEIGGRVYFSCLMRLDAIPKMFTFREWAEFTPEQREQRILNKNRIPDIARYILDNEDGYLFASITASYKCEVKFTQLQGVDDMGFLEMEFEQANFVINDGQHRCAAIAAALKENPALGAHSISVLLFPYENLERVQQMFSDLNRFVAKTSRSLDILYDKRDSLSRVMLDVCRKVPAFIDMVDKDAVSLPVRSAKLFTLTALYDATKELIEPGIGEDIFHSDTVAKVVDFWETVSKAIPDWMKVKNGHLRSIELRQEKICAHSVVLRAIGGVGHQIIKDSPTSWKPTILCLNEIDWRKNNPDWENVCIIANSVVSNRQARVATRAYLKNKLGLDLTEVEKRALPRNLPALNSANDKGNDLSHDLPTLEAQSGKSWVVKNVEFPHGTEFRSTYHRQMYNARVDDGFLVLNGEKFSSPSAAAIKVTGNSVNGWIFWECKLPGKQNWQSINSLRGTQI
jgi:DNA sulfur modification protein DndB